MTKKNVRPAVALAVFALGTLVVPPATLAIAPSVAPATLLAPFNGNKVMPPVLFQWTTISPAQTFVTGITSRTAKSGNSIVAVSYELQISDRPDVASHVLYDAIVDSNTYLFYNNTNDPNFTSNEEPNTPLVGGVYYWRVRGVFAGTSSNFSQVQQFVMSQPGVGSTLHALGLTGIALASVARVGSSTIIQVTVRDLGNFPESGGTLNVLVGGQPIASVGVPDLSPGRQATISVPWTPDHEGYVEVAGQLQYSDDDPKSHAISQTEVVTSPPRRKTTLRGILAEQLGSYYLADAGGNSIATLTQARGSNVPFSLLTGQHVRVNGYLYTARNDFVLEATDIQKQ